MEVLSVWLGVQCAGTVELLVKRQPSTAVIAVLFTARDAVCRHSVSRCRMHASSLALRLLLIAALVISGVANAVAGVRMNAGSSQESAPPCHSERAQTHAGHAMADTSQQLPEPCCSDPENCRCGCLAFFPSVQQPLALVAPMPPCAPHPAALGATVHSRDQGVPMRPPIA